MAGPERPEGVGATAVGVAGIRALESARPDALFHDGLAAAFVAVAPPPSAAAPEPLSEEARRWSEFFVLQIVLRTRFYDDYLFAAAHDLHQVVLLAAGLD